MRFFVFRLLAIKIFFRRWYVDSIRLGYLLCNWFVQDQSRSELSLASSNDDLSGDSDGLSSSRKLGQKAKEGNKVRQDSNNKSPSTSNADHDLLNYKQREAIREKIKNLRSDIQADETAASKVDREILKKSAALKKLLLKAKRIRSEGDKLEKDAKEVCDCTSFWPSVYGLTVWVYQKVDEAAHDRHKAQQLRRESKAAKSKFLSGTQRLLLIFLLSLFTLFDISGFCGATEERPIQQAMKLQTHDQHAYRKIQLLIAKVRFSSGDQHKKCKLHKVLILRRHAMWDMTVKVEV